MPEENVDEPVGVPPVNEEPWPEELLDAHRQRYAQLRQQKFDKQDAKKQKMIGNGVPEEKHSI